MLSTALKIYLNGVKAGFMVGLKNTLNIILQEYN